MFTQQQSQINQAKLPLKLWGHYVLHACYLINRLPTPMLKGKTPYEVLFNKVLPMTILEFLVVFVLHLAQLIQGTRWLLEEENVSS